MSASAYRRSCDQLGLCQDHSHRCSTCRPRGLSPSDAPSSRPMALEALDLHRVHHVDTHDLEHGQGVSIGGTCLPPAFTHAPGAVPKRNARIAHDHGDAVLRRWAGASLGLGLALMAVGAWLLAAG